MNEMEKLQNTKTVIDKLAEGINPFSDQSHAEDSALNDVTLTRCFFHASQILDRVLRNGGVIGYTRRKDLRPFVIGDEQKSKVVLSEKPISITGFAGILNDAASAPDMRRLSATQVTAWLEQSGFLTTILNVDGKKPACADRQRGADRHHAGRAKKRRRLSVPDESL